MILYENKNQYLFAGWLFISLILVFTIIIVGGLTRLTDSGLSITEWELFAGILPPIKDSTWINYFELYKQIPQYQEINFNMTLDEFKIIFYWEYAHRVIGRLIGLFFLIPLIYFHFSKTINKKNLNPCYIVFFLILVQGVVGWYMVKSGLVNNTSVSHYRLSLHLSIAFIIISILFWQLLNITRDHNKKFFSFSKNEFPYFFLILILFLQVIVGAFVSGLDAGRLHQTWPLMGYNYFPDDIFIKSFKDLINFEDHSLVQFYHRNMAYLIVIYFFLIAFFILKKREKNLYKPMIILSTILLIQILLGIFTLISNLNILLASAHQISSVLLIFSALNLYNSKIN